MGKKLQSQSSGTRLFVRLLRNIFDENRRRRKRRKRRKRRHFGEE